MRDSHKAIKKPSPGRVIAAAIKRITRVSWANRFGHARVGLFRPGAI